MGHTSRGNWDSATRVVPTAHRTADRSPPGANRLCFHDLRGRH